MSIAALAVSQATAAITKYGSTVVLVQQTSAYDEATGEAATAETIASAKAVVETRAAKVNPPGAAVQYDAKFLFAPTLPITTGDLVQLSGVAYRLERVDAVMAQDSIAIYEAYGKRE